MLAVTFIASACGGPETPRFRKPIAVDWDMADIPEPKEERASQYYDFFDRSFSKSIHRALDMPRNARLIAVLAYFIPVVGAVFVGLLFKEALSWNLIPGAFMIAAGAWLTNLADKNRNANA